MLFLLIDPKLYLSIFLKIIKSYDSTIELLIKLYTLYFVLIEKLKWEFKLLKIFKIEKYLKLLLRHYNYLG